MLDTRKVERLREERGLTMQQAAEAAGIAGGKQGWNNLVTGPGNVRMATLDKIAHALECGPCDLLVASEPKRKRGGK